MLCLAVLERFDDVSMSLEVDLSCWSYTFAMSRTGVNHRTYQLISYLSMHNAELATSISDILILTEAR